MSLIDDEHSSAKMIPFSSTDLIKSNCPPPSQIIHGSTMTQAYEYGTESQEIFVLSDIFTIVEQKRKYD